MSYRELAMMEIKEVLRRWSAGQSVREIARGSGVDRKTVRRYICAATNAGLSQESPLDEGVLEKVRTGVQGRSEPEATDVRRTLESLRERIEHWLSRKPRPLRLVRIHELLAREGYAMSYTSLRRYAHRELGWRQKAATVRVADAPMGEEAQIAFGLMGTIVEATGKRRKL